MAAPTYTYTFSPGTVPLDTVRFLVGDTDMTQPLLSDQEINYAITNYNAGLRAAWFLAKALGAKFARQVTSTAGKLSQDASDRAKAFNQLAKELWHQITIGAVPSFGGVSVSQKQAADSDFGSVQPSFTKDQFDNPEAAQDTSNQTLIIGVNNFP